MNIFDNYDEGDERDDERSDRVTCNRCGSCDVRWRQQGGKWVLFSSKPGVEHVCGSRQPDTDGFTNEEGEQA